MPTIIPASYARDNFADLLNQVKFRGQEFIIEKQGKPAAILIQVRPCDVCRQKPPASRLLSLASLRLKGGGKNLSQTYKKMLYEKSFG